MTEPARSAQEAAARLESTFEAIRQQRMQDVPILNAALRVEAVGMRAWQERWLGALVTPWFINLVALPAEGAWPAAAERESVWYTFPSGRFEFIAAREDGIGCYHACSLFSPVLEFADHETACETARLALESLFDPALLGEQPAAEPASATVSRREFLRGSGRNS